MVNKSLLLIIMLSFILAACAPSQANTETMMKEPEETNFAEPGEVEMKDPTEADMDKPSSEDIMSNEAPAQETDMENETMEVPAWLNAALIDVRTSEDFVITDFEGKVILVETIAMWCPTCKKQQMEVKTYLESLDMNKELIVIGLDIDPNENAAALKTYAENNGFAWIYAIAPAEVSREISSLYGDQFLNPPSTPMLLIDRHGNVHPLPFGLKNAGELASLIESYQGQ